MKNAGPQLITDHFRSLKNDYNAAKPSRFRRKRTQVASQGSGADYHYKNETEYLGLIEQARDLERNDPLAGRIVDSAVTNTIQGGFNVDPQTGDSEVDLLLWERWNEWANDPDQCDIAGEMTFNDIEDMVLRRMLFDGDVFILPLESGHVQLIEAHRCRTPSNTKLDVVHGVLLGPSRQRLEFWFTKDEISPNSVMNKVSDAVRVPARDRYGSKQVLQVYKPVRINQTRGVTAFAPVFDYTAMLDDINFAKLVQQQVASCFAIIRERATDYTGASTDGYGQVTSEQQGGGYSRSISGIAPGMEVLGNPGETIKGFSANVPNAEYFQQVSMIVRVIASNIGAPPEISLHDTTNTVFHGYRGAVDEARRGFRRNQRLLITRLHSPLYRIKLNQWIADDPALASAAKRLGRKFYSHKWNAPNWPYIDSKKDAEADAMQMEKGLTSPRRWASGRGFDYEELTGEIVADNAYKIASAKQAADKLNDELGMDITWRDILKPLEDAPQTAMPQQPVTPDAPDMPDEDNDQAEDDQEGDDTEDE
jgi:lambda family phage portal protein